MVRIKDKQGLVNTIFKYKNCSGVFYKVIFNKDTGEWSLSTDSNYYGKEYFLSIGQILRQDTQKITKKATMEKLKIIEKAINDGVEELVQVYGV